MGRPGVTYQEVASAAEKLTGLGKNPTIESIRALIGSGSSGTLGPFLRTWKSQQGEARQVAMKENLPEELVFLMKGLWTRVFVQAEDRFGREKQQIDSTLQEIQQRLDDIQKEYTHLQQKCVQKDHEITRLSNEKLQCEQTIASLKNEKSALEAENRILEKQAENQEARIQELHRLHQQTQKNLEHYREASLEQRRQDQQSHDSQRHQLEQLIHQLRHEISQLQHQNAIVRNQNESLSDEKSSLQAQYTQSRTDIDSLREKLADCQFRLDHSGKLVDEFQKKLELSDKKYHSESRIAQDAKNDLAIVTQRLTISEENLRKITDQHQALVKEKWIFEQERNMFYENNGNTQNA